MTLNGAFRFSLFHVVVDNDETATKVIQYLNKEKAGRTSSAPFAG